MERNSQQIQFYVRKTKKDLVEIVEAFDIGKIKVGFRSYNLNAEPGSRETGRVDFYMNIDEFELLCHNLLSGNIISRLKKEEEVPTLYKGSVREGSVFSRTLAFNKSNRGIFFNATEGPGKKTNTGAIQPLYKLNEAPNRVSISLDTEEVKSFALQGKRACDVYYMRMASGTLKTDSRRNDGGEQRRSGDFPIDAGFDQQEDW